MAIEKTLNTRIKLKYDLYSNWSTNNPKLLAGEVALAYIPTGENNSVAIGEGAVNGTTPPQVLIKVGDGEHNYNDLKYVSALAADVLTACKSEAALTTFINNVIAGADMTTNDKFIELSEKVDILNGDVDTKGSVAKAIKDAIDALDLDNTYAAKEHSHTKAEIEDFAHTHTKSEITDFAHTHTASEITDFATEVAKVKVDEATKATQDGNGKVIADTYAEKATTLAGYGIGDAYTKNETDTAVQGAKDYAKNLVEAIPAQTDYTVTCTDADHEATSDAPAFKRHTLTQNGNTICTIDIPKELVVEAGSVKEVTEAGKPYDGAVVGDKYIELVIANQDTPIYVPAKDLVDIYTAKADATEVQIAISNTNEISAGLTDAVKEKLNKAHEHNNKDLLDTYDQTNANIKDAVDNKHTHTFVESELNKIADGDVAKWNAAEQNAKDYADGKVSGLADGQVKTNKEAIEAINNESTGILAQAKAYSDSLNHEDTKYTAATDGGLKLDENNAFSINDSITFIFDCGNSGVTA